MRPYAYFAKPGFLSTLSLRRATAKRRRDVRRGKDFYPRSPCGERQLHCVAGHGCGVISIHALLAESDPARPPRRILPRRFLSTLSLRRATRTSAMGCRYTADFYPRSPCGERRSNQPVTMRTWQFLSTLSLRRATQDGHCHHPAPPISIHALLAESDPV